MNETTHRVLPHVALLNEIEVRRKSFAVQASGLAPVLDMLSAYIVATEARIAALEQSK